MNEPTQNDGGPAFPSPSTKFHDGQMECTIIGAPGMSLRDFATIEFAKAFITTLPDAEDRNSPSIVRSTIVAAQVFADEFLKARAAK